jgi:hypothetical protein
MYPAIDYSQNLSSLSCFSSSVFRNPRPYPAFISCALRSLSIGQQPRDERGVRLLFRELHIHHDAPRRRSDLLTGPQPLDLLLALLILVQNDINHGFSWLAE